MKDNPSHSFTEGSEVPLTEQERIKEFKEVRNAFLEMNKRLMGDIITYKTELKQRDETIKQLKSEYATLYKSYASHDEWINRLIDTLKDLIPLAEQYVHYLGYLPLEPLAERERLIKIHSDEIGKARKLIE